eukprot:2457565-Pleurochrysis_carterae.AAC.1
MSPDAALAQPLSQPATMVLPVAVARPVQTAATSANVPAQSAQPADAGANLPAPTGPGTPMDA